ncbi:bifunctional 3-(3-hydroxy-phenyl)propionate/3-hydroxycinnamic acid hydroxylase [Herbaspirillum rhizosphaerae]|uniref:Bifunctional 3-(3-hydroxy-phenyl)propionate/3-hydroxycinnamic acid hydroxylase n=1 Tax=Herbaspirillum rhizosphaerae TaxID=346179 RepID=A0ABW8ZB76_9BURK
MKSNYDVIVVGFGPSGAVAAALLGQAGLNVLVIDRLHHVYDKPRAIALDHEIMRVFQQLGVAEAVAEHIEPFTPSEYYGADGELIKRLAAVEPPFPMGYTPSMVFTQPPVERILRERVASLSNVDVHTGIEFKSMQQDANSVTVTLRDENGTEHAVSSKYLIGCDGASSSVRDAAGIELEDLDFDEPWLVVDVLVNEKGLAKLPVTSVQFCEPERPCSYVIGPKNHRRWEISLLEGEDPKYMATEEGAWSVLKRWISTDDATLWRQASYRFHALVAKEWNNGRVFIAGDAAHQQPPFLGQGMCQGVRDVVNLIWKLKLVITGNADESLLHTYGEERGAHVRALTGRIKDIGKLICERDPEAARQRDAHLIAADGGTIKTVPRQNIIPSLDRGLLSPVPSAANGTLFPQPRISVSGADVLMDRACGTEWRIVFDPTRVQPVDALLKVARLIGAQLVPILPTAVQDSPPKGYRERDGVVNGWFERIGVCAAIVRPDHYVYGAANDIDDLLEQLNGLQQRLGETTAVV